jgi:hypothetical protein
MVGQYDTMKPYRPKGLTGHDKVEHFYRGEVRDSAA